MVLKEDFKASDRMKIEELKRQACKVRRRSQKFLPERPYKYWVCKYFNSYFSLSHTFPHVPIFILCRLP